MPHLLLLIPTHPPNQLKRSYLEVPMSTMSLCFYTHFPFCSALCFFVWLIIICPSRLNLSISFFRKLSMIHNSIHHHHSLPPRWRTLSQLPQHIFSTACSRGHHHHSSISLSPKGMDHVYDLLYPAWHMRGTQQVQWRNELPQGTW